MIFQGFKNYLVEAKGKVIFRRLRSLLHTIERKQISLYWGEQEVIFISIFPELSDYTNISDKLVLEQIVY